LQLIFKINLVEVSRTQRTILLSQPTMEAWLSMSHAGQTQQLKCQNKEKQWQGTTISQHL
jgi:hypothetical protein